MSRSPDALAREVAAHAAATLALNTVVLGDEYRYAHLPLAVTDAVFSIGVRYASTQATVRRLCDALGLQRVAQLTAWPPAVEAQLTVSGFLAALSGHSPEALATRIFGNRQRTSTRVGAPLKAAAVVAVAEACRAFGVESLQDFQRLSTSLDGRDALTTLETAVRRVPGQSSGIGWRHLTMLAGRTDEVKPDRMLVRFVADATGHTLTPDHAASVVTAAWHVLHQRGVFGGDLRTLDHAIWLHQRGQPSPPTTQPGTGPARRAGATRPPRGR